MFKFDIIVKLKNMSEKKSFSEDAKGFLNMWKNDYAEENKEILERKKQRDAENEALNEEIKKQLDEIKIDLSGKAKEIYVVLEREFNGFSQALKEGTATVAQKLEIEKRMEQLSIFLQATSNKSSEKINSLFGDIKSKLNSFDKEIESEIAENASDKIEHEIDEMGKDIKKGSDSANNLFDDIK